MSTIAIKRIYEEPVKADGYRMLIDRLWPRGVKKERAAIEEWNKEIAPSVELRKWFNHKAENFKRFSERYELELYAKPQDLERLLALAQHQKLTLLYVAKDEKINHALVLLNVLNKLKLKAK